MEPSPAPETEPASGPAAEADAAPHAEADAAPAPGALDPLTELLAERACERLIVEFLRRLDLGDPSTVAELFTPDGVWEWPQGARRIEGREALREYFGSRPADRLSRRMCTNILVTVDSPTSASATSYFATYRVDGYTGGMLPPRLPANVGHYEDTFRKVDGVWLLATRVTFLPFGGPTERVEPPPRP
ncbi:nuclear transport factor 2 family protein [Streptomyces sparsogenes]|uniref:nuclear transport factor 2 family protein n=1 Tax=Streptomyces sparsogenes TaxID=67365 RepID=UPI0034040A6E